MLLSEEEEKEAANFIEMEGDDTMVVLKKFNVHLLLGDLRRLIPNRGHKSWINDEVVNFWGNLLQAKYRVSLM